MSGKLTDLTKYGFVKDPATGRYFKAGVIGSPDFVQRLEQNTRLQIPAKKEWPFSVHSKSVLPIMSALSLHQKGLLSKSKYGVSALQCKLKDLKVVNRHSLKDRHFRGLQQHVVNSGNEYFVVGRCQAPDSLLRKFDAIDRVHFRFNKNNKDCYPQISTGFIPPYYKSIQDICAAGDRIMFISNSTAIQPGSQNVIGIIPIQQISYSLLWNRLENAKYWKPVEILRCCASDEPSELAVVGTAKGLFVIRHFRNYHRLPSTEKDIFSVSLRNQGRNVLYGCSDGTIFDLDFRNRRSEIVMKLDYSVICVKMLESENELIASAYEHDLCLIDRRMYRVVRKFHDHVNSYNKIPFSYCDSHNLLCSAGQDNKVRIWSLDYSKPLTTLSPTCTAGVKDQTFAFLSSRHRGLYVHNFYDGEITSYAL